MISDFQAGIWLGQFRRQRCWLGLMTSDPSQSADPLTAEVAGSVYRRPEGLWRQASSRLLVSNSAAEWNGLPALTTVYAVAAFDALFNGNMLLSVLLPEPRSFPVGGSYSLPAGELFLGF